MVASSLAAECSQGLYRRWEPKVSGGSAFRDEFEELQSHPGREAWFRWSTVRHAQETHARNANELNRVIAAFIEDEELALEVMQNVRPESPVRAQFYGVLSQRLHNWLASAKTLVDQTRRFVRKHYAGHELKSEYDRRVAALAADPAVITVQKLRNFMLHYDTLPIRSSINWATAESESVRHLELGTAVLLEFDGWGAVASQYLKDQGESLDLPATVAHYDGSVTSLYEWLHGQFDQLHGPDLADYNSRVAQWRSEIGLDDTAH